METGAETAECPEADALDGRVSVAIRTIQDRSVQKENNPAFGCKIKILVVFLQIFLETWTISLDKTLTIATIR